MDILKFNNKEYEVDSYGFLVDSNKWDEDFANGVAEELNISGGLTTGHWKIINFIREHFRKTNLCPIVYETCNQNKLSLNDLRGLFPAGYQRGACRISGITFKDGFLRYHTNEKFETTAIKEKDDKVYCIDRYGFLTNPSEWDENFTILKALEMKMPPLNDNHWRIIKYLREKYQLEKRFPNIYEVCGDNNINIEEFNNLFPDGYHRGVVKLAGLRLFN